MKVVKKALIAAKSMPKGVWVAAVVLPGGLTVLGVWLSAKCLYQVVKGKMEKK